MKPIVIVGAGIAGLSAAAELKSVRLPFELVDERHAIGGRCTSLRGDGWLADPAVPWMTSADTTVIELIRAVGLEADLISLHGPIVRHAEGRTTTTHNGPHWALRHGFESLFEKCIGALPPPILGTSVAAIRWMNERRVFLFRDGDTGATLTHPLTRKRIEASGVVLALPPRRAAILAAQSRVLLPAAEALEAQPAQPAAAAVYVVPRINAPWSGWVVIDNWAVSQMVREEMKSPELIHEEKSVLVVKATPAAANARYAKDGIQILYEAARNILPELPEEPLEAHIRGWEEGITPETPDDLLTDPAGVPVAVAVEAGDASPLERLALAGVRAARTVANRVGR